MNNTIQTRQLGSFHLVGNSLRVTDPCYTKDVWCSYVINNMLPGEYKAEIDISDEGDWGERVASLIVRHKDYNVPINQFILDSRADIGVDSGQAGFFNNNNYPHNSANDVGKYNDPKCFYGQCCNLTLGEDKAGVMEFGVVSRSGLGDGSYTLHTCSVNGKVVAAMINFIDVHNLLPELDEEYEDEDNDKE